MWNGRVTLVTKAIYEETDFTYEPEDLFHLLTMDYGMVYKIFYFRAGMVYKIFVIEIYSS